MTSDIDVQLASLEMQHEFCGLWNELVRKAQVVAQYRTGSYAPTITTDILGHLRKSYIALHGSTDVSPFITSIDKIALTLSPGSPYPLCNVQDHRHMSSQTSQASHVTTASLTNPPSSRPPLLAPPDSNHQNVVVGVTEDAKDASNDSSPDEATSDLAIAPSLPTPSHPPLAALPSAESIPAVQDSQGQTRTPNCRHGH